MNTEMQKMVGKIEVQNKSLQEKVNNLKLTSETGELDLNKFDEILRDNENNIKMITILHQQI